MGMFLRLKGENAIGQYRLFIYHYQRIKRHKWWNFVSSRDERIEWRGGLLRFLKKQNLSHCQKSSRIKRNSRCELWIADRKLLHQFEGFLNAAVGGELEVW